MFETLGAHYDEPRILDLIVSKNLARRHLNPGQRAMVALKYEEAIAAATRNGAPIGNHNASRSSLSVESKVADLPPENPKSRDRAAAIVGASGRAVQQAKAVERDAPDLAEQVRAGRMALDAADRQRKERLHPAARARAAHRDHAAEVSNMGRARPRTGRARHY